MTGALLRHLAAPLVLALGWLASAAGAQPAIDATPRILALESLGRARPNDAAQQLEQLRDTTPAFSTQRLDLLTVQGLMLAVAAQPGAAEHAAAQLEAWGNTPATAHAPMAAAAALLIRARGMARSGDLRRADPMMRDAIARLPATLLPRERYRFVSAQAYIAHESGRLEAAVRRYHEALALADQQDAVWRQSEARDSLAYSYYGAKQVARAHALVDEALLLAERAQDWFALGRAHTTAGIVLDSLGDLQGERHSFELALDCARRAGAKIEEVGALANLADFYLKIADYKTALAQAERALPLARELHDTNSETVALANIGLAQISLQHLELGKRYVAEAIAIDQRRGSVTGVSDTVGELGVYLEKAGDLAGAVAAYHQHRRLATTILRDDQQKAILAMQEQYDADHRSRALALLGRESDLKAEQLRRRDLQQQLWWLLAAAFMLSFAVVALLYRRVRRTNRLLSKSNEQLKVQSERDPLTGLANRRHFQAAMRQLADDGKLSGTVYLIDIDHFKHINDRHGHGAGDAVLVEVARRLRETLRETDMIVRWGGEEFLVFVPVAPVDRLDEIVQRIMHIISAEPIQYMGHYIQITVSIGYSPVLLPPDDVALGWERVIGLVDKALYMAKLHGRNRAYGLGGMLRSGDDALAAVDSDLEKAWRDGVVDMRVLVGAQVLDTAAQTAPPPGTLQH